MRTPLCGLALAAALAAPASAQPASPQAGGLKGALGGIGFLLGDWKSEDGKVADTGGTSHGASTMTAEADGHMLLRRDRTEVFDAHGKPTGAFSQVMLVYPEDGSLRADYGDGEGHVIHYASAVVTPGRSVVFTGAVQPAQPTFRLSYTLTPAGELAVDFAMLPPGGGPLQPIASGHLKKAR
jgi:hypothetical protein